jgi:hypothetical protein
MAPLASLTLVFFFVGGFHCRSSRAFFKPLSVLSFSWCDFSVSCSIKGEVKGKNIPCGWKFSCFAAHLIERDLF